MTDKEKLEKAVDFIKSIEQLDLPTVTTSDIIDGAHVFCEECGEECEIDCIGTNEQYVKATTLDELRDKAWHLIADLT